MRRHHKEEDDERWKGKWLKAIGIRESLRFRFRLKGLRINELPLPFHFQFHRWNRLNRNIFRDENLLRLWKYLPKSLISFGSREWELMDRNLSRNAIRVPELFFIRLRCCSSLLFCCCWIYERRTSERETKIAINNFLLQSDFPPRVLLQFSSVVSFTTLSGCLRFQFIALSRFYCARRPFAVVDLHKICFKEFP